MKTMTNQEVRKLAAEELDAVAGGMKAVFQYGGFRAEISADAGGYKVCTSNSNTCSVVATTAIQL